MILIITSFVCLCAILVSWFVLIWNGKWYNIPGPFPLPIIGNGLDFMTKSSEFLQVLRNFKEKYGDAYRVFLLHDPYVVISHPKYVQDVVTSSDLITKGRSYIFLYPWLGNGLLTSTGQRWKLHRKFLTPAFHFNILQNYLQIFLKNERILVKKLEYRADGKSFDIFPDITLSALDNVTESIMGVPIDAQVNSESEYVKSIEAAAKIIMMRMRNPVLGVNAIFNLTKHKKIHDDAIETLHKVTNNVIQARRKELAHSNNTNMSNNLEFGIKNKFAFLDSLLLTEVDGEQINEKHVREEVDTFMFEGHDTTSSGIAFALYCISNNKQIQDKILEEQKSILGDDLSREPEYTDLKQMKYLEMVIKESLRLYPAVPLIERMNENDCEIGGILVRKNMAIIINILELQRHPDLYENPLEFNPERFVSSSETGTSSNAFNWLAFSAGPRNCIGQKFAMMEMKVTIAGLVKHFEILPSGEDPILCAELVLRSENGVKIVLKKRQ